VATADEPSKTDGQLPGEHAQRSARENVHLTLAINDYDHVRDLVSGAVPVEGVDLTCLRFGVEEIFWRFTQHREWEVSEFSLCKYSALRASGDDSLVAIPVFPSRTFRHSAIFVRADGPIDDPAALAGGRIGVPEWSQTATVYARGVLHHRYGVGLADVEWVQGGTNEPGRVEGIEVRVPAGVTLVPVRDRALNDMLLAGELDAIIAAHPPTEFKLGTGRVVRLFSDYPAVEERYYRETGVFPIMHVVAMRRDVHEANPWIARNLQTAFEEAKRRSLERVTDSNAPRFPLPWGFAYAQRAEQVFGPDFWPYGVEANRPTLDAFLGFAHEQGVCATRLAPEDLFLAQASSVFRI
jgi:4,5-dihydroxyphthalate decarboxylase